MELTIDPDDEGLHHLHRLITSIVAPRPIGWISTSDPEGRLNLAPYSYFNAVASVPPVVMFSSGTHDRGRKDTARNALDGGEFVANLVTRELIAQMDQTGTALPYGESEYDLAGLTPASAETVSAPRVGEALAHLECTVHEVVRVYDYTVVFGDVQHVHVDDSLLTDGVIDMHKVDSIGRLGGPYYTQSSPLGFTRQRYPPDE